MRNMRGKHGKKSRVSALAALALCAVLIVTFMPNLMFSANAEESQPNNTNTAVVQSFNTPDESTLEADTGSSAQDLVNSKYPSLKGTVRSGDTEKSDVSVPVKWTPDTEKSDDSHYVFQAELKDENGEDTDNDGIIYSLKDSNMKLPEVSVKKSEKKDAVSNEAVNKTSDTDAGDSAGADPQITAKDILGDAYDYGIVTNDFQCIGDAETNVAAQKASCQTQQTGNDKTNEVGQKFIFGELTQDFYIKGYNAYVFCPNDSDDYTRVKLKDNCHALVNHTDYTKLELQNKVQSMLNTIDSQSANMGDHQDSDGVKVESTNDNSIVDITGKPAGTYYVTVKPSDFYRAGYFKIKKNDNQTIVLNVRDSVEIKPYEFWVNDEYSASILNKSSINTKTVIWNFPNATQINTAGSIAGVILAPKATITTNNTGAGWIAAGKVIIKSGEWHNTRPDMPDVQVNLNASLHASKFVNNETPNDKEKFQFGVYERKDNKWTQIVPPCENEGGNISFNIPVGDYKLPATGDIVPKTIDKVYQICELDGNGNRVSENSQVKIDGKNYTLDAHSYYAKVSITITKATDSQKYYLNKTVDYYKDSDCNTPIDKDKTVPVFSNTTVPSGDTTSVSVQKKWVDENEKEMNAPDNSEVVVQLMKKVGTEEPSEVEGKTLTLSKANNWRGSFEGLDKKENNQEITYSVVEKSMSIDNNPVIIGKEGKYTSVVQGNMHDGFIITNKLNKEQTKTTSVKVTKSWNDGNNQDGKRPQEVQVQLLENGVVSTQNPNPAVLSSENGWTYEWNNLDPNKKYSVQETIVPNGYTYTLSGSAANGFTITNTHTPETTSVSGIKTWDDKNNQDGKRPDSITVRLWGNNKDVATKTVTANDNWTYNFTNLPKYEKGKEITYTITEDAVADYSTKVDGYNITNSYTPGKTSVTVTKAWLDNNNADKKRPASIQVQLYADGKPSDDPVTITAKDNWTHTWSGLDAKESGTDIKYTVEEVNTPNGYTSNVSGNAEKGYTITNTENTNPQPTTTYTVHKVWDLGSGETVPDSVQMQLYENGAAYGSPVAVTRTYGWTYTWTGLPQTENGKLNTWSVKEVDPDNQYTATVVNGTSSATVTNRSNNNAGGKTQVSVHKVWKLDNGRTAASSVQAQLYRNGEAYGDPVTLSAGNHWSYLWTGLTKTDAQGNTISWTVREVNVPSGFTSTVTGTDRSFTITNDDKPQDNHNKHNNSEHPNNNNNKNNKPVHPSNHNKNNTTVHPGTPTIPKNTGKTVANRGTTAGSTPRTGDQTSLGFWLAMLTAGAAGTAAAVLLKRRNRKEEE